MAGNVSKRIHSMSHCLVVHSRLSPSRLSRAQARRPPLHATSRSSKIAPVIYWVLSLSTTKELPDQSIFMITPMNMEFDFSLFSSSFCSSCDTPHCTSQDFTYNGMYIPKDTDVILNLNCYTLHHNEDGYPDS